MSCTSGSRLVQQVVVTWLSYGKIMTNPYTSHIVHSDKPDALPLDLRGERNIFENEVIVKFIFDHKKGIFDHKRVIFDHKG